jgi:hypothetical protein
MLNFREPLRRWAAVALMALCTTVSCGELSRPSPTPSVITFTLTPTVGHHVHPYPDRLYG